MLTPVLRTCAGREIGRDLVAIIRVECLKFITQKKRLPLIRKPHEISP